LVETAFEKAGRLGAALLGISRISRNRATDSFPAIRLFFPLHAACIVPKSFSGNDLP
jgi:hypothetical protein